MRSQSLQGFLEAARIAYAAHVKEPRAINSLSRIFSALDTPGNPSDDPGARIPACAHLARAADPNKFDDPPLRHRRNRQRELALQDQGVTQTPLARRGCAV